MLISVFHRLSRPSMHCSAPVGAKCRIRNRSSRAAILRLPVECVDVSSAQFLDVVQPFSTWFSFPRLCLYHSKHNLPHQHLSSCICVHTGLAFFCDLLHYIRPAPHSSAHFFIHYLLLLSDSQYSRVIYICPVS